MIKLAKRVNKINLKQKTLESFYSKIIMQKISFPKIKMQFEPIFLQVLWQFLSARRSRADDNFKFFFGGKFLKIL